MPNNNYGWLGVIERRDYRTRPFVKPQDIDAHKTEIDARRLKDAWDRGRVDGSKASQKELAGKWDVTPGLVSQYINGHGPLNVKWQLRFAEYLGISPIKIWPDFQHKNLLNTGLDADALDVALDFQDLDETDRAAVRSVMASMRRQRA